MQEIAYLSTVNTKCKDSESGNLQNSNKIFPPNKHRYQGIDIKYHEGKTKILERNFSTAETLVNPHSAQFSPCGSHCCPGNESIR